MAKKKSLTVCVVDTETTMKSNHSHLIYDFAYTIFNIYDDFDEVLEKSFLISNTLNEPKNFIFTRKGNEGERIPFGLDTRYAPSLVRMDKEKGRDLKSTWENAYKQFRTDLSIYGVDIITAYNLPFDLKAIQKTHAQFTDKQFRLPNGISKMCLMDICSTFVMNRDFKKWLDNLSLDLKSQILTSKGNISYSAETIYRYLFDDIWYSEQHTGLRDVRMERKITRYVLRKWLKIIEKEFLDNVRGVSWITQNKVFTTKEKRELRMKRTRTLPKDDLTLNQI